MTIFQALAREGIDGGIQEQIGLLIDQLRARYARTSLRNAYYDGRHRVKQMGIAVPSSLADFESAVGWPATVVDVLEERLDIDGFTVGSADESLIADIWDANNMPVDASMAHLDSLIAGVAFVAVSPGDDGEPQPLLTVESPMNMTGAWNARARRLDMALLGHWGETDWTDITVFTPDLVIELAVDSVGRWVANVRPHGLDRVPVVRLVNRPRAGRQWGRSEISRAVMSYTDHAVRTILGLEISREFYSAPQRYVMGANADSFQRPDGSTVPAWESYLGKILAMERDDEGNVPTVGQFPASSPGPYIDELKGIAQMLAAEAAIPPSYLGFYTENPPGADGIRAQEARLVKRSERRQKIFGAAWSEVLRMAVEMRDGSAPSVSVRWRDASTPTRAATADAVTKLVGSGILPPDSDVTLELIGLDPATVARVASERRRAQARGTVAALVSEASKIEDR